MMKHMFFIAIIAIMPVFIYAGQARNIELIDVPTANSMARAEFRADFKMYPGGILTRLYIGVFDRLMLGGALRADNIIGQGDMAVEIPKVLGKIRITDDEGAVPAIAIGYEGEGYESTPARGVYLAITKEIPMGSVFAQVSLTGYTNNFTNFGTGIDMGTGLAFAVTRELNMSFEFDGIFGVDTRHLSAGIGYFFDPIEIDLAVRYGLNSDSYWQSRILKVVYVTYF
ncbi:MAG: hypothetical protein LLG37_00690 [Spirochaetia bacterium]|nr:hypothetical protein [Spirochaetia bacterium]